MAERRNANRNTDRRRARRNVKLAGRIALLGILLALLVILILLIRWNIGTKSGFDAEEIGTEYETEELDQVFYVTEEDLATSNAATDGQTHILFLGNELFSDGEAGHRIPDLIGEALREQEGADVFMHNASVPGSRIAPKSAEYNALYPYDLASFFYMAGYIARDDYTFLDRYAADSGDERALSAAETIREVVFEQLDAIVIGYDAIDYLNGAPVFNPDNDYDAMTYCGALKTGISVIRERYPHIRFVFLSPTYCYIYDEDGNLNSSDIVDIGNGDLTTYLIKAIDVCQADGITVIDNYSGTVDADNADTMLENNIHLTDAAREHVAEHFMRVVYER